jgi:hypothetical protein
MTTSFLALPPGRAVVELTVEKSDGSLAFVDRNGGGPQRQVPSCVRLCLTKPIRCPQRQLRRQSVCPVFVLLPVGLSVRPFVDLSIRLPACC